MSSEGLVWGRRFVGQAPRLRGALSPAGPSSVLNLLLLALSPLALALNPSLDVSQYSHFSWKYRDGFTKGPIAGIAQTSDGYLWFATGFGLYRFDGVRPVPWQPPPDQSHQDQLLPSGNVLHLLPARDGTLWISTTSGLANSSVKMRLAKPPAAPAPSCSRTRA